MKIIKLSLSIVLCIALSLSFSAYVHSNSEIDYSEEGITVIFDAESVLSFDEKQFIADRLVFGDDAAENGISTYAFCWLLGHDIVNESVTIIEHEVSSTVPRCKRYSYNVETCTKCDYINEKLISTMMILCCPED